MFVRKSLPARTDPKIATGSDFAVVFLDMALFQPEGKSRKDRLKIENQSMTIGIMMMM